MRPIDADALESKIIKVRDAVVSHDKYSIGYSNGMSMAHAMSVISPTIDAVPVVRCKDCKHFSPCEEVDGVSWTGFCNYGEFHTDEGDFCSRGERRTDVV